MATAKGHLFRHFAEAKAPKEMLQDNSLENKDHRSRSAPPSSGLPQPIRFVLIGIVLTSGAGLIVALIGLYALHNTTTALIGEA